MKDEASGIPVDEFIGLISKMYSCQKTLMSVVKQGKTGTGIKKDIKHENYKDVLFNNKQVYHKMKTIRSNNHKLGSYEINKISPSYFDDKRYLHDNGIDSCAYGHYKIQSTC